MKSEVKVCVVEFKVRNLAPVDGSKFQRKNLVPLEVGGI